MNCDELQQLAALEALGLLEDAEASALRARLERDPAAVAELARFREVAAQLAASTPAPTPGSAVRERILARVRQTPQRKPAEPGPLPAGFQIVRHNAPWLPGPIPGTRFKILSAGPRQTYAMLLLELAPGTVYPEHDHDAVEELHVLTGDLETEGRALGPGDHLHAEPGSHHHALRSVGGCTAILVTSREAVAGLATA